MVKPPAKKPWPHQRRAIDALTRTLRYMPRATAVSASASGKTLIAQQCADNLAPQGRVLVLVPYLELITQTADAWRETGRAGQFLGVCCHRDRSSPLLGHMPMTTKAPVLADQIARAHGPVTVFATYQSLQVIIKAHRDHRLPAWDLAIADEAHHTAGALTKDWAAIHDDTKVPAHRRIYLTATPRTGDEPEDPPNPEAPTAPLASMNDIDIFGPTVFTLTLTDAIAEGILADFRLVFPEIGDEELRTALTTHPHTTPEYDGPRVAAAQIALLRTMARYDLRQVLCFFNHINTARMFAETLNATAAVLPDFDPDTLWAQAVYSGQGRHQRAAILAHFGRRPDASEPIERRVLTNVRVISEGFDLPGIDGLAFIEPKYSTVEVVQAVGRGLRQPPGSGKIVTVIMPVYLAPRKSAEESVKDSDFYLLWKILTGLRTYDQHPLSPWSTRHGRGLEGPMPPAPGPERADEIAPLLQLRALEPDLGTWMCGMSSAVRYLDTHGDLDIPADYIDPEGFPLGRWLAYQCDLKTAGNLAPARLTAMNKLGVIWRHTGDSTEHQLDVARAYFARNGHLTPAREETLEGSPVGEWLCTERTRNRHGREPTALSRALSEITPHWNPPWPTEWQRMYALAHAAARADRLDIPVDFPGDDCDPAIRWIDRQVDCYLALLPGQQQLLADLPLSHPLALLLQEHHHRWDTAFCRGLRAARHYRKHHGHLRVPAQHIEKFRGERVHLGTWITRLSARISSLTLEEINALEHLGIEWDPALRRITSSVPQSHSPQGWSLANSRLNWPLTGG
ncbi:DEAD/DEAH box helicase [Streptomyces ochraceiscleroticus]|uniref:Helicase associated domain protein n=1 Tax=Streptomyces ochraceiscleroticus TaxID=47761 RepID=A0ABW1MKQ2_9ACTN|nr:DEAD/DEAH box helicase [Streptomyces ochraceiscleroticus]